MNNTYLTILLFAQLGAILLVSRAFGILANRFGQPQVVAEMIAGIALGPSLLGLGFPEIQQALFPWDVTQQHRDSQSFLVPLSQLGVGLYMFTTGLDFKIEKLSASWHIITSVAAAGIAIPFALGVGLGWWIYDSFSLFPAGTRVWEAALFMGVAMSVTAFPVLARIIQSKNIAGTVVGNIALGAGAIGDVIAWAMLAMLLASLDQNLVLTAWRLVGTLAFLLFAIFFLRPFLRNLESRICKNGRVTEGGFTLCLALMVIGGGITEILGMHVIFGAFIIGLIIPRGQISEEISRRIAPVAIVLLLPLFFAYSGLNTQINLLNSAFLWGVCLLILSVAVLGKAVGCWLAARATGVPQREALAIGALMNTRGLMELIVLNIGLQRGLISSELFSMMVVMAIVTTLLASPLLDFIYRGAEVADRTPTLA